MNLPDDAAERDAIAGEWVLGTLEPAERMAFEAALMTDDTLRAAVYRWQDQLLPLALDVAPVQPAADGWALIQAWLAAVPPSLSTAASSDRDHTEPAANAPTWRRLRIWQTVAGGALAACLVLALLLTRGGVPEPSAERYLAWLQPPQASSGQAGWLVEVTSGQRVRLLPVAGNTDTVPPGRALQFWTKLEGGAAPTSLGLVTPNQATELPAQRLPGVGERQLFELTLEPASGSPTGKPTGPVLYVGRSFRL